MSTQNVADRAVRTQVHRRIPRIAAVVRIVVGALFVWWGVPKFTDHEGWVSGFGGFGLPESSLLVYSVGLAEVLGGLALVVGFLTPVVAGLLALLMVGAAVFGGVLPGSTEALTQSGSMMVASLVVLATTGFGRQGSRAPTPR